MPSEPVRGLFDPDMTVATYRAAIDASAACLQELVNYSTGVLSRCLRSVGRDAMHMAVLLPYRHIIELKDGIQLMVARGEDATCGLLLRAIFDCLIGIGLILQEDTRRWSYARLYFELRRRQRWLRYVVPGSEERKILKRARRGEVWAKNYDVPSMPDAAAHLQKLSTALDQPDVSHAASEAKRLQAETKHRPKWHELYGGPGTLDGLAQRVGRGLQYEWLYRRGRSRCTATICHPRWCCEPVENAYIESLNASLRKECLNAHWFQTLDGARQKIEAWRQYYNGQRPHNSLGNLTPQEFAGNLELEAEGLMKRVS